MYDHEIHTYAFVEKIGENTLSHTDTKCTGQYIYIELIKREGGEETTGKKSGFVYIWSFL